MQNWRRKTETVDLSLLWKLMSSNSNIPYNAPIRISFRRSVTSSRKPSADRQARCTASESVFGVLRHRSTVTVPIGRAALSVRWRRQIPKPTCSPFRVCSQLFCTTDHRCRPSDGTNAHDCWRWQTQPHVQRCAVCSEPFLLHRHNSVTLLHCVTKKVFTALIFYDIQLSFCKVSQKLCE